MRFHVGNDTGGHPSWWLYAANNRLVAWAGESFSTISNARRAAEAFKAGAKSARYEIYSDAGGRYRWRAWRSSDKVASSGEAFSNEQSARRASENVRDHAGGADL
ncbi:Uncharacterized conserved protein YegP, UPF0339 family [Nocardioides scoriae]|uniref:Uncharacterized conserved protein YegP, UPF0339 family n=1 Tax=Nocardioides scoriae TaxID=642780 RepID=A0A1H1VFM5_9ACTN|nr:Uncharacterized conserved protein YegP, UPF0339 family [Nocardioides scoriae]